MQNWKYAKEKKVSGYIDYYRPPYGKKIKVVVKDIEFIKKPIDDINKTIFQSDIVKADDTEMDKVFTIFNYDNVEFLKKKLGMKRCKAEIELIRKHNEDTMEDYFEILSVKKIKRQEGI